jgi:polyisoprenoid-binding protein YceI
MLSRSVSTILIVLILGLVLAGCGAATEEPPAQQPVSEAVTTEAPAVAATEAPAELAPAPVTDEPAAAIEAPAEPSEAAVEEAVAVTEEAGTEPQAAEASAGLRAFQIVAEQSEATYQVQEEFFNRPVNIVNPVGRTNAIEGEFQLTISSSQVQLADNQFVVDLRTLTTDEARRDERIRNEWLESNTYPYAEFTATAIENFPADATEGQDVSFQVTGDMTIREITRPQTFDVTARLDGNTFTGTATTYLLMRDYGFEPPSILGMLEVADGVTVTLNFVAQEVATGS